jgi:hypothetical protein
LTDPNGIFGEQTKVKVVTKGIDALIDGQVTDHKEILFQAKDVIELFFTFTQVIDLINIQMTDDILVLVLK